MPTTDQVWDALRQVNDPEMPLSIVDLGMVGRVELEAVGGDPAASCVQIDLLPTFVGCPALAIIEADVRRAVTRLANVASIRVRFVYDPPWSVDRISAAGRAALHKAGITVPAAGCATTEFVPLGLPSSETVACPLCGATRTQLVSHFGPTRCKMIYYCDACRNQFEHMKRI
jgi:ring-1,2-phenylacetyl-CoA epoxidase subunit PaaD